MAILINAVVTMKVAQNSYGGSTVPRVNEGAIAFLTNDDKVIFGNP